MSRLANHPAADTPAQIGQVHADERRTAVYLVLADIPRGMVISYGELAALAGLGRAAHEVAAQHIGTGVIQIEKRLQVGKVVSRTDLFHGGIR